MSNAEKDLCWGIDLGGTKIEIVVSERRSITEPLIRSRLPTEAQGGYRHILSRIQQLVDDASKTLGVKPQSLGASTPGAQDRRTGAMRNSNTICLNGNPLRADIETMLGIPVRIANDANCFAFAESQLGAGRGFNTVFGVILGTGVGGGVIAFDRVLEGPNDIGGEWGHNPLEENGEPCYCGKSGCVERVLSGPALEGFYLKRTGVKKTLKQILADGSNDPAAEECVRRLHAGLGRALGTIYNILDPDVVVLGGGISNIEGLPEAAAEMAKPWIFHDQPQLNIARHELGDSAGVFGAALLTTQIK